MRLIPGFIYRRIEHRPNLVRIIDNIGWLFFEKVLRMGVGLLVGVWLARYLGPEQFGLLNFALAFTGLFAAITTMGLPGVVVREIVRDPHCFQVTLGTAGVLHLFGGLIAYPLILFVIHEIRPDDALARSIVAITGAVVFFRFGQIAAYWFESQVKSKYTVWVQNSVFLLFSSIKVLLILQEAPLVAFAWIILAEAVLVALVLLVVMGLHGPSLISLQIQIRRAKTLLHDSWPLILSGLAVMVYMKIDQIMLGQMVGDEAVGIYSAALTISEVWYFIPVAISASVFPAILEAKKNSASVYRENLQQLYDLMVVISVSVALPMTFLAAPLVVFLYGESYAESGVVLAIHIWATVFVSLGVASSRWFLAENRQLLSLQRTLVGAVVNIVLNLMLIPRFGVIGAAVATVVSQALASWVFDFFHTVTRPMFKMKLAALSLAHIPTYARRRH